MGICNARYLAQNQTDCIPERTYCLKELFDKEWLDSKLDTICRGVIVWMSIIVTNTDLHTCWVPPMHLVKSEQLFLCGCRLTSPLPCTAWPHIPRPGELPITALPQLQVSHLHK